MTPERAHCLEKATQTGDEPEQAPKPPSFDLDEVVLRDYEAVPPGPTRLTGNALIDYINQALDALVFGGEEEPSSEETGTATGKSHGQQSVDVAVKRDCEGGTGFTAFLSGLCMCPANEPSFAPLPNAVPVGRFCDSDPFTREVLGQLCKDEPETYLSYIHFHQTAPTHYTYVPAEVPSRLS